MRMQFLTILLAAFVCADLCAGWLFPFVNALQGYGGYGGYGGGGYGRRYTGGYGSRQGGYGGGGRRTGRTYSDIARVLNPNPYAFVGRNPYPGQPFYPQG